MDSSGASGPRSRSRLIGESPAIQRLRDMVRSLGPRRCPVLIRGESGSGKELVARALHEASGRTGPLVPVDCTTLRDALLESQLFGHVRGAFTGADRETLGFIRAADRGTLFLDEIGELAPPLQAKLLRFLQEGTITPLGSTQPIPLDARVVAATHRDLHAMVERGEFRLDLYYRLNVVQVDVAPLRERLEDLPLLARHLLRRLADDYAEPAKRLNAAAETLLLRHAWPGNVRELANALERAFILGRGDAIEPGDLPESIRQAATAPAAAPQPVVVPLDQAQSALVRRALEVTNGHQGRAAELLQIERRRLYRMVDRFGLRELTR